MPKTAAWTRKEGKNPKGGLNAKGRKSAKAQGMNLKPPVSAKQAAKSPKSAARRKSFCARMGGSKGPLKTPKDDQHAKHWRCANGIVKLLKFLYIICGSGDPQTDTGGIRLPKNCAPTLGYKNHTRVCDPCPPMLPHLGM
jgi:hypothetical protein